LNNNYFTVDIKEHTNKNISNKNIFDGVEINKWIMKEKDGHKDLEIRSSIGDRIFYKIRVKNTTDDWIKNIVVRDFIPGELSMNDNTTHGYDQYHDFVKFSLKPGEVRDFLIELKITNDVYDGQRILSNAEIEINNKIYKTNTVTVEITSKDNAGEKQVANISNTNIIQSNVL